MNSTYDTECYFCARGNCDTANDQYGTYHVDCLNQYHAEMDVYLREINHPDLFIKHVLSGRGFSIWLPGQEYWSTDNWLSHNRRMIEIMRNNQLTEDVPQGWGEIDPLPNSYALDDSGVPACHEVFHPELPKQT